MRKLIALSYVLVVVGFACIAHAQLTQTGAGKVGSGGGGGFTPCAGTLTHMPDPNNLTTANWASTNLNKAFTATDPNLVANNATDLQSSAGGGSFNTTINASNLFPMLAATGTYAFNAYFKSIVVPPWIFFRAIDTSGFVNTFGSWFNIATAAVGSPVAGGNATLDCARAGASTNGYVQVSFAGHVGADVANARLDLFLVDGSGTGVSTLNQEINAWQVSP